MTVKLNLEDLVIVHYKDSNRIARVTGFFDRCVQVKTIWDNKLKPVGNKGRSEIYDPSYLEKITPELAKEKKDFWAFIENWLNEKGSNDTNSNGTK